MPTGIQGTLHQGQVGRNRGLQCTAIALLALAFAFLREPSTWTANDLDSIILDGNSLYDTILDGAPPTYLSHTEVAIPQLQINSHGQSAVLSVALDTDLFYGVVGLQGNQHSGSANLQHALTTAFGFSDHLLVTFGDTTVAITASPNSNYALFDSHARDSAGLPAAFGHGVVLNFGSFDELVTYLTNLYDMTAFNISPVRFEFKTPNVTNVNQTCQTNDFDYVQQPIATQAPSQRDLFTFIVRDFFANLNSSSNENGDGNQPPSPSNPPPHIPEDDMSTIPASDSEYQSCLDDMEIPTEFPHTTEDDISTIGASDSEYQNCVDEQNPNITDTSQHNTSSYELPTHHTVTKIKRPRSKETCEFCNDHTYSHSIFFTSATACSACQSKFTQDHSYAMPVQLTHQMRTQCVNQTKVHKNTVYRKNTGKSMVTVFNVFLTNGTAEPDITTNHSLPQGIDDTNFEGPLTCEIITVQTFNNTKQTQNAQIRNLIPEYAAAIRENIRYFCKSCERFLFSEQIHHIAKRTQTAKDLQIEPIHHLCSTCYTYISKNTLPPISLYGNALHVPVPPKQLSDLNRVERRLIAKIQIFMTEVLLPGGQYAEKGLILNLPVDTFPVFEQTSSLQNTDIAIVHFESSMQYAPIVSPAKICRAFKWLKSNNILYADIDIPNAQNETIQTQTSDQLQETETSQMLDNLREDVLVPTEPNNPIDERANVLNTSNILFIKKSQEQPVNIYETPGGEELAFPWLYPNGQNGFIPSAHESQTLRKQNISPSMYFRLRIFSKDERWRKDRTFLLHACVAYDLMQMKNAINIYLKTRKPVSHGQSEPVTAGNVLDPLLQSDLVSNSCGFLSRLRGTAPYLKDSLYDLLAMIKTLGPPTLFVTLSADDLKWPEITMLLQGLSYEEALKFKDNYKQLPEDPVLAAVHFHRRYKALFKHVIEKHQPLGGKVLDSFIRVEFQNRGSPHYHIFYWIDRKLQTNEEITAYIDEVCSVDIPDESEDEEMHKLVTRLQTHHHSDKYCRQKCHKCRFGFPQKVSDKTYLLNTFDMYSKANRGKMYVIKRKENARMVNAYNPTILRNWQANMDISYIHNADSLAYYVCKYVCKAEPEELKNALGELFQNVFAQHPNLSRRQKMTHIGMCVLKKRRVSAQEVAFKLSDMPIIQSSRKIVHVNTRLPDKRFRRLKSRREIETLSEENPNSTDIFMDGLLEYYKARPIEFEQMSLYEFASWYEKCPTPKTRSHGKSLPRYKLLGKDTWIKKRQKAAIVRSPPFPILSQDNFYSLLMLHLPHRNESELIPPHSDAKAAFKAKSPNFQQYDNCHYSLTQDVDNALRRIQLAENELQATYEDDDTDTENDDTPFNFPQIPHIEDHIFDHHSMPSSEEMHSVDLESIQNHIREVSPLSLQEYQVRLSQLSKSQRTVFNYVDEMAKKKEPFFLFISGGAGTGKSFLTEVLMTHIELTCGQIEGVAVTRAAAPTGAAATQIAGSQTLHSLLKLPFDLKGMSKASPPLLKKLKKSLKGCKYLFIDEISMVSDLLLSAINERLTEVSLTNTNQPFGGCSLIIIGDLCQLKPVNAPYPFKNKLLWTLFKLMTLKENHRQGEQNTYTALLNRARVGLLEENDHILLKSRVLVEPFDVTQHQDALRIFPLRDQVKEYNELCLNNMVSRKITHHAQNYFSNKDFYPGLTVPMDLIPKDDRQAGNLCQQLHLAIGARVMLIQNMNVRDKLVNGAMGQLSKIIMNGQSISRLFVKFDNVAIPINTETNDNSVEIEQIEREFFYKGRHIVRKQYPLQLCWAATVHKVQGASLDKAVIDLGSDTFENGQAYVAMSRVRSLDGLILCAYNPVKVKAPEASLNEYHRLRQSTKEKDNDNISEEHP